MPVRSPEGAMIGPVMRQIIRFVYNNPGCSKRQAAAWAAASRKITSGYRAVDRAIDAGFIRAEGDRVAYRLYTTPAGDDVAHMSRNEYPW